MHRRPPPDLPPGHWARTSIEQLWGVLLKGDQNGEFKGWRTGTRYEAAVLLALLLEKASGRIGGLENLAKKAPPTSAGSGKAVEDLRVLGEALERAEYQMDQLLRLSREFQQELASLGIDADAASAKLGDLQSRTSALESAKPGVKISGDLHVVALAGASAEGRFGLAISGHKLGVGSGSYLGQTRGLLGDLNLMHEGSIGMDFSSGSGVTGRAVFAAGNLLGTFGSLAGITPGASFHPKDSDLYIGELNARYQARSVGLQAGRLKHSSLQFVYRRSDRTPYLRIEHWDDGQFLIDGVKLDWKGLGGVTHLYGGRSLAESFDDKNPLTPISIRVRGLNQSAPTDRVLGIDSSFSTPWLQGTGAIHISESDTRANGRFNNMASMGLELRRKAGGLNLRGGIAKSTVRDGDRVVKDSRTNAVYLEASYSAGGTSATVQYRSIDASFANPGSWGRVGTLNTPTGYRGLQVFGGHRLNEKLRLNGRLELLAGDDSRGVEGTTRLKDGDRVVGWTLGAEYGAAKGFTLDASLERWDWDFKSGPGAHQQWLTLGANWSLSAASTARIFLQLSEASDQGSGFFEKYGLGAASRYRGSLVGSQLSFRF